MIHGFIISRLQGLHNGHIHLIEAAMEDCDHLTIIIGSANKARSIKNPWSVQERATMLADALVELHFPIDRMTVTALPDFDYHDDLWEDMFHRVIQDGTLANHTPVIFTSGKENDSALRHEWARDVEVRTTDYVEDISATRVRRLLLTAKTCKYSRSQLERIVPTSVFTSVMYDDEVGSEGVSALKRKYRLQQKDKYIWKDSPYPVIKCATDNVVFDEQGHVLLILRKDTGLWALPGGHVEPDLDEMSNALKELKEETGLELAAAQCVAQARFTDPERCEIGRMTTTAYAWQADGVKPDVCGGDDAAKAKWFTLAEVQGMCLYDDHYGIILTLLRHVESQRTLLMKNKKQLAKQLQVQYNIHIDLEVRLHLTPNI